MATSISGTLGASGTSPSRAETSDTRVLETNAEIVAFANISEQSAGT